MRERWVLRRIAENGLKLLKQYLPAKHAKDAKKGRIA
jgi:hypothetical protein